MKLDSVRDRVSNDTRHLTMTGERVSSQEAAARVASSALSRTNPSTTAADEQLSREQRAEQLHNERKRFNRDQKALMEELVPRKEGHERVREKRREKGAYAREKESGEMDTSGVDTMGGSDDDLKRILEKRAAKRDARQSARGAHQSALLDAHAAKEASVRNQFAALLGAQKVDPQTGRAVVKPRQ